MTETQILDVVVWFIFIGLILMIAKGYVGSKDDE